MSELSPSIRRVCVEDLESLCRIDQTCFAEGIAFKRSEFSFLLNHPEIVGRVAEGLHGILGFILGYMESSTCAHILTLDVLPEFRRCKIGTLLMNVFHDDMKKMGIPAIILEVGSNNIAAQRLYAKFQYVYVETLIGYYRGNEDAYRMLRSTSA